MDGEAGRLFTIDSVPGRSAPGDGPPVRQWPVLRRLEKGRIGTRGADGSASVRRRERADTLLFGPFWRLPCGQYRLSFRCRAERPRMRSQPVLGVEIIVLNRDQQAWRDFTAAELAAGESQLDFDVPQELSLEAGEQACFEFRFLHLHNADLTVDEVELRHLDDGEALLPPRRWRLLGRQWLTPRARRNAAGMVIVPALAPPGTIADSGRPFLWLPEGPYRLDLRGRATAPRHPDEPVVAVEIGARPLSGRLALATGRRETVLVGAADFTARELADDVASVTFAVTRELSLDGGDDVPFEFRLLHLGNAGLTLDSVEVVAQNDIEAEPPPNRYRLLGRMRARGPWQRPEPGLEVRRDEPPGVALASGRPRPRLAAGAYRLSVCAGADNARDPTRPVLGLEVSAVLAPGSTEPLLRRRSLPVLRRDFAVNDLSGGRAEAVFTVPAEALAEGHAFCDIRLLHTGNADLRLGPVELRQERAPRAAGSGRMPAARRNVLVIGNCQAETVRQGFNVIPALRSRFRARYQYVCLPQHLHSRGIDELRDSDLILVQDLKHWEHYPLREHIPEGTEIVRFPFLNFAPLWPFDHYNGPGDKLAHDREWPNFTFQHQDGLLARLRREIPDKEARFRAYRDLTVDGIVDVERLLAFETRRLAALDRRSGFGIGRHILDNFRQRPLFYTTNHPNRELVTLLMEWVMRQLGIDEPVPNAEEFDHLRRLQVPVHPKIAAALGVEWADESTVYIYEGRPITWEAYIRAYIGHYG